MCYAVQKWHEQDVALGRDEGTLNKTKQIVANMLKRGFSNEDISSLTECDQIMIDEVRATLP